MIIATFSFETAYLDHVLIYFNCYFHVFCLVDVLHYICHQDRRTVSVFFCIYILINLKQRPVYKHG